MQDETGKIHSISQRGGRVNIVFRGSLYKSYPYGLERVVWYNQFEEIAFDNYEIYSLKGDVAAALGNISAIRRYYTVNTLHKGHYAVFFKGVSRPNVYSPAEIIFKETAASSEVFRYLRDVCFAVESQEDPTSTGYLSRQFSKIETLENTAAAYLINPSKYPSSTKGDSALLIYPFGSNLSQMEAVDKALNSQLSLIEGPPGTGKTQTILNIAANLIIRDLNMLITSPNGEATRNVVDKLEEEGYGFLVASLGRKANRDKFIADQPEFPAEVSKWVYSNKEVEKANKLIRKNSELLKEIYQKQQNLSQLRTELADWRRDYHYFLNGYSDIATPSCRPWIKQKDIQQLRDSVGRLASLEIPPSLFVKMRNFFVLEIGTWNDYRESLVDFEISLNRLLFERTIERLEKEIAKIEKIPKLANSEEVIREIKIQSERILRAHIYKKYQTQLTKGRRQKFKDFEEDPERFRSEFPIVTSTTNAARAQMGRQNILFDYIIIDESSQASLTTGALALSAGKSAIVVGDTKQLPCVITKEEKAVAESISKKYNVANRYCYTSQSLLSSLSLAIDEEVLSAPRTLLREHYRCHPDIIGFCNQMFYDNNLLVMTNQNASKLDNVLSSIPTTNINHDRKRDYNRVQAGIFKKEALPRFELSESRKNIGVVTPYRNQVTGMKSDPCFQDIKINTVHKYQGREKDAIAFITRSNNINNFINSPNMINVAVSRAKRRFTLIAAPKVIEGSNNIADLHRYILYRGGELINPSVSSSFDLLYKNKKEQQSYLSKRGANGHDTLSEVQVAEWIDSALRDLGCEAQFGYIRNYPLKQFLIDLSPTSPAEREFINRSAHTDFLLYRKSDKSVVLCLEVDGAQHLNDPKQRSRDELKNAIFIKCKIPLIRLKTHEYEPAQFILNTISKHYNPDENKQPAIIAFKDRDNPWGKQETG